VDHAAARHVDHVVQAPEAFDSRRKGRLVVLALTPRRVEVTPLTSPARSTGRVAHAAAR
jgi:hypothetical protein